MIEEFLKITRDWTQADMGSQPNMVAVKLLVKKLQEQYFPTEVARKIVFKMDINVNQEFVDSEHFDEIISNYAIAIKKIYDCIEWEFPGSGVDFLLDSSSSLELKYES